ncbi:MAG: hypothetical protein Q9227_009073 [Pyrenula ochraceoflavens]
MDTQPFLSLQYRSDDEDDAIESLGSLEDIATSSQSSRSPSRACLSKVWTVHLIVFILYTGAFLFAMIITINRVQSQNELLPLPAREAIKWETRSFPTRLLDNPFTGDPRPELDQAWHKLLLNDNIKLPSKDLDALDVQSVYLNDGSGQVTSLSVFHSLHCLVSKGLPPSHAPPSNVQHAEAAQKIVRHSMFPRYYHAGKDEKAMRRMRNHADHCIEYIREALMCKPDLSLISFRWINQTAQHPDEPSAMYPTNFDDCQHECANWDSLNAWAAERVFDLGRVEELRTPRQGLKYSDEEVQELSRV